VDEIDRALSDLKRTVLILAERSASLPVPQDIRISRSYSSVGKVPIVVQTRTPEIGSKVESEGTTSPTVELDPRIELELPEPETLIGYSASSEEVLEGPATSNYEVGAEDDLKPHVGRSIRNTIRPEVESHKILASPVRRFLDRLIKALRF
jgi:hypothetical protein